MTRRIFEKAPQERLIAYLKNFLRSLNPDSYHSLSVVNLSHALKHFTMTVMLSGFILLVLSAATIFALQSSLDRELAKLSEVSLEFNLTEPIVLQKHNVVLADKMNYSGQNILVTEDEFIRRPALCSMLAPACLLMREPVRSRWDSISDDKKAFGRVIIGLAVFLLPGIILFYTAYIFVKSLAVILFLAGLAYLGAFVTGYRVAFRQVFVSGIYASGVFILAMPFDLLMWNLHYVHLILFVLLFMVSLLLLCEKRHRYRNA